MDRNAPLTVEGRRRLCRRIEQDGFTIGQAAESMIISRQTASKWWNRYPAGSLTGLEDRPCRPHMSPAQTRARLERRVVALRQSRKLGPARLGPIVGRPLSTVHRLLARHGCGRLAYMDRPTGQVIRRIPTDHVSELVRLDVKKLGKIPPVGSGGAREGPLSPLPGRLHRGPRRRAGSHRDRMRRSMWETKSRCSSERSVPTTRYGLFSSRARERRPAEPTHGGLSRTGPV